MQKLLARAGTSVAHIFRRFGASIRRHPWLFAAGLPFLASVVAGGLAVAYIVALIPLTPSVGDIQKAKSEQASVVLSADNKELAVFKRANRAWVKLADISPHVVAALIATEDRRFFEHDGLDLKRTIAAAIRTARGDLQGGSTITQQLARNLYPEEIGRAPTLNRSSGRPSRRSRSNGCTARTTSSRPTSIRCPSSTTPMASSSQRAPTSTSPPASSTCWRARRL